MGKRSLTRFAAYLASYGVFEISVAKGYGHTEFREDLKKLLRTTGAQGVPTVFLINDLQIVQDSFLEDIHFLLNKWEIPYLYAPEELEPILQVKLTPFCLLTFLLGCSCTSYQRWSYRSRYKNKTQTILL